MNSASLRARSGDSVIKQLEGERRLPEAAGRVEPRGDREADVFAFDVWLFVEAGDLLEGQETGRGIMAQAVEAVADEDAVFIDERHDVGHGADRGQADGRIRNMRIASPTRLAWLACWQSAQASFSATPAPHRPANGYVEPGKPGWTIAAALGSFGRPRPMMIGDR